jgi:hypothetical protein
LCPARRYETTANALAYTIYCLSTHPEAQQRVLAEVDAFSRDRLQRHDELAQVHACCATAVPCHALPHAGIAIGLQDVASCWVSPADYCTLGKVHVQRRHVRSAGQKIHRLWLQQDKTALSVAAPSSGVLHACCAAQQNTVLRM